MVITGQENGKVGTFEVYTPLTCALLYFMKISIHEMFADLKCQTIFLHSYFIY